VQALVAHGRFSRTVLTSRRPPVALGDDPRVVAEAVDAFSLEEAALLTRELPHLGALLRDEHAVGLERGRELVTHPLAVVQGHPKFLALAEAQAHDPEALAGHLERTASAWERGEDELQAFFQDEESRLPAEAFLAALEGWARAIAGALPPAAGTLFHVLCTLEEEDRQEGVVEGTRRDIWCRLAQLGEVPALMTTLVSLIEMGLVEIQQEGQGTVWYVLHPGVAEFGRAAAGEAVQVDIDHALASW